MDQVAVVGRRAELAAMSSLLAAGTGGLLIEGEAGVGKTILWRAGVTAARAKGHRVLACQPVEAEAHLAFAAVGDLLDPVIGDALPQLPAPQRRALEAALLRIDSDHPVDERAVAFGLLSVARAVARVGPVLIAVDDWQWLDSASARVLKFLLRRLGDEQVQILATARTGAAIGLERDIREEWLTRLTLEPLPVSALHELLATRVGKPVPRPTLLKIQAAAGGNMVFAIEIARTLAARAEPPPPGANLPVPDTLNELVARRVAVLPPSTRNVLLAAAALAQPTISLLAALGEHKPEEALAPAESAELVVLNADRIRFCHPLIASAVYGDVSPEQRRALHRRLARMVTEPEERARHLALAADGPSRDVADSLEAAAHTARGRGAPDAAAELLEMAAEATPPDQHDIRRRRLVDAAEQQFVGGDRQQASRSLDRLLPECPSGPERARVLRLLGEVRYHDDSFPEARRLLQAARAEAGMDAAERAAINLSLAYVDGTGERVPVAAEQARTALAAAEEHGQPGPIAEALAGMAVLDFIRGCGLDEPSLSRALALEDITRRTPAPMRPSVLHGALMSWAGRPDAAQVSLDGIRARLLELGDEAALPFLAFVLGPAACSRGDLAAAARYSEEGLAAAARVGTVILQAYALTAAAFADAYAGRTTAAFERAGHAVALFVTVGCRGWTSWPLSALAHAHLSLNDAQAAATTLRPLVNVLPPGDIQEPAVIPFLPDGIQALIMVGDLATAGPALEWLEHRGRELDRPWALATAGRCRALFRAAQGELAGALETIETALDHHQRLANPVELARTLLVRGQLQRRANQRRLAKETLEKARSMFDGVGAAEWSQRAGEELTRLGLRRSAGPGLTPREYQVAENAAAGATNNQIAAALYISPKTVEANLARVYRKLGFSSRAELGAWMAARRLG